MQDIFEDDVICCIPLSECATFYIDSELYQDIFDMIGKKKSKITFQWTLSFIQNHFSLNLKDFRSRSRKAGEESWQYWNCISDSCWGHSFYFIIETSEQIMCSCYTTIVVMKDKMLRMLCKTERQNNGKIIGS